jgi:superfamily II DNA or RNA helicase
VICRDMRKGIESLLRCILGMSSIQITERFLLDTGGWPALKHAKALVQMGRVVSFHYSPPILRGLVREGETEYRAGLKIRSYTDVENLCSCRDSREWGTICAHSLALGLTSIRPETAQAKPADGPVPLRLPVLLVDVDAPLSDREVGPGGGVVERASDRLRLELNIVLPPNLEASWEKNQIVVGFEVVRNGGRVLASALDANQTYHCSMTDREVLELGREFAGGKLPGMTILDRDNFLRLVGMLAGHPRITLARKTPVAITGERLLPRLSTEILEDGRWRIGADRSSLPGTWFVGSLSGWVWSEMRLRAVSPGLPAAYVPLLREPITLSAEQGLNFVHRELAGLSSYFRLDDQIKAGPVIEPALPEVIAIFEGSLNQLGAKIQCRYGHRMVTLGVTSPAEVFVFKEGDAMRSRNLPFERISLRRIQDAGFTGPSTAGEYLLRGQNAILSFFARELLQLQKEWKVTIGSRFEYVTRGVERITPKLQIVGSGEDWFDFSFSVESASGQQFSTAEVQRLLQVGQNVTRLRDGRLAILDTDGLEEFQATLRDCDPAQSRPGTYRIKRSQAAYVDAAFGELAGAAIQSTGEWENWTRAQRQLVPLEAEPLGSLEGVLRPYQKEGVYWLRFLSRNGLGGILADEMGLGKTLQTLAFLRTLDGPSLVVCPSSLLFNWVREAQKFVPELKVLCVEGADRGKLFRRILESNLVLTSYPLLRRDIDRFRDFKFSSIFLDEATHIKNPDTQNAQAAMALVGRHRFVLTGTPVENSVRDLWSILHFVLPGYLGRREDFRERYELPISRGSQPERARLAKRLRPVMLRRLKQQVVKELPEKIEQITYCDLSPEQEELYQKLRQESRRKLDELSGAKDQGRARITMLTALLRLRQVCCDLRLLGQEAERPSGKLELLEELLEEAIDGGHRVLLFSQFVSMLRLIRTSMDASGIRYGYLDGATKDRAQAVDAFQQSDNLPLFLISLKAGGVGLNLSAADTVIHFDPWWNPAVEAQATDRAHRIGQTRVVTSYKLIARGTVEEKILSLQQKKREMIQSTVESEEPVMSGLSMAEISELLLG